MVKQQAAAQTQELILTSVESSDVLDRIKQNLPAFIKRGSTLDMLLNPPAESLVYCLDTIELIKVINTIAGAEGSELDAIAIENGLQRAYRDSDPVLRIRAYNSFRDARERGSLIGVERDIAHSSLITPYFQNIRFGIGLNAIGVGYALGGIGETWLQIWDDTPASQNDVRATIQKLIPVNNEVGLNYVSGQAHTLKEDDLSPATQYYIPLWATTDITHTHNSGAYPIVITVESESGKLRSGGYTHIDTNRVRIQHARAIRSELWIQNPIGTQAFTSQTSVVVTHSLGIHPIVQIINSNNKVISARVKHDSDNQFTITFTRSTNGTILWAKPNRSQSFTNQTEIVVEHFSGIKPILAVEDSTGEVFGASVIYNNNDKFTVKFAASRQKTGVIYYSTIHPDKPITMTGFQITAGGVVPIATTASYQSKYIYLGTNYANKNWFCDWISYKRWDVVNTERLSIRFSTDMETWSAWKEYLKNGQIMDEDIKQYIQFKFDLTMSSYDNLSHFMLRRLIVKWLDSQQFLYGHHAKGFDIHAEIPDTILSS